MSDFRCQILDVGNITDPALYSEGSEKAIGNLIFFDVRCKMYDYQLTNNDFRGRLSEILLMSEIRF